MNQNNSNYLENLRIRQGADSLRRKFIDLAARHRQKAIRYLNHDKLRFPTLYLLMPDIQTFNLYDELIPRNNTAIQIWAKKSRDFALAFRLERLLPQDNETNRAALKWMFDTGLYWDGPSNFSENFNAAIDTAAAMLIATHKDMTVLPAVCELIFWRHRQGLLIHDLVWGFFQSYEPDSMMMIAKYLNTGDAKDVELACRLLHIDIPDSVDAFTAHNHKNLFEQYKSWFYENNPYLRFTGEHFLQTSEPNPLYLDNEAKYLGKRISPKDGLPLENVTPDETACLIQFRKASENDQEILSSYSARLHNRDFRLWKEWIMSNISEQVSTAIAEL